MPLRLNQLMSCQICSDSKFQWRQFRRSHARLGQPGLKSPLWPTLASLICLKLQEAYGHHSKSPETAWRDARHDLLGISGQRPFVRQGYASNAREKK
jgi:hypothetical protein